MHQFDDPAVGCLRIAQEDRPQPIALGAEQFWPIAGEGVVEQLAKPSPSRQNRRERSTSAVQIAE